MNGKLSRGVLRSPMLDQGEGLVSFFFFFFFQGREEWYRLRSIAGHSICQLSGLINNATSAKVISIGPSGSLWQIEWAGTGGDAWC